MRTIIADRDASVLEQFEAVCEKEREVQVTGRFTDSETTLDFAKKNRVEFAVLDAELGKMDGFALARNLQELHPGIVLVLMSVKEKDASEAMKMKADFYLLKPFSDEDVREVIQRALLLQRRQEKRVIVRTLSGFDVFVDGRVVNFKNAKAKELFALCVDKRGGTVTMEEAVHKLWSEKKYDEKTKMLYRKAIIYLKHLFEELDAEEVFLTERGMCYVDAGKIRCDYFEYLKYPEQWDCPPEGYLEEYAWAEKRNTYLDMLSKWQLGSV